MPRVRNGIEVVDEAALAAQECLVLEAWERAPDPRLHRDLGATRLPYYRPVAGLRDDLRELLEAVRSGEKSPDDALEELSALPYRDLAFARVDVHRELRQGAPEAILAEGKTPAQVAGIFAALLEGGAGSVLATRADDAARAAVREVAQDAEEDTVARCIWVARGVPEPRGLVAMVSAGTSDGPVLHEARIRAELLGTTVAIYEDVGVAGVHRLAEALPTSNRRTASSSSRGWTVRSEALSEDSHARR